MLSGTLRIIGGKWRSRHLRFPALDKAIRPTPDPIRETVFNWLAPVIQDAVCLDPFAGSGALGFEALSRGARWVSFLDRSPPIVRYLRQQIEHFSVSDYATAQLTRFPLTRFQSSGERFNLVFLDPPFHQGLLVPSLQYLDSQPILAPEAWVYIEYEAGLSLPALAAHWQLLRVKQRGKVGYGLLKRVSE